VQNVRSRNFKSVRHWGKSIKENEGIKNKTSLLQERSKEGLKGNQLALYRVVNRILNTVESVTLNQRCCFLGGESGLFNQTNYIVCSRAGGAVDDGFHC